MPADALMQWQYDRWGWGQHAPTPTTVAQQGACTHMWWQGRERKVCLCTHRRLMGKAALQSSGWTVPLRLKSPMETS